MHRHPAERARVLVRWELGVCRRVHVDHLAVGATEHDNLPHRGEQRHAVPKAWGGRRARRLRLRPRGRVEIQHVEIILSRVLLITATEDEHLRQALPLGHEARAVLVPRARRGALGLQLLPLGGVDVVGDDLVDGLPEGGCCLDCRAWIN